MKHCAAADTHSLACSGPNVDHQIAPFEGGGVSGGFTSRATASFVPPRHRVQIYDAQLQARMLTVFPISLSNALVVVPSKGYLASQQ